MNLLRGTRCWVFFVRDDALAVAGVTDPQEATRRLKMHLGKGPRVVAGIGHDGVDMLNGKSDILRLPTIEFEESISPAAGDAFSLFATLASSSGMSDEESIGVAIEATTRRAAGLDLPRLFTAWKRRASNCVMPFLSDAGRPQRCTAQGL